MRRERWTNMILINESVSQERTNNDDAIQEARHQMSELADIIVEAER